MSSQRQANIELLRIISMLMILNLHSFWGFSELDNPVLLGIDTFRECLCICAVHLFVLISGYFGIKWKVKSFFNLIFQPLFYFFLIYVIGMLVLDDCVMDWNFPRALIVRERGWWFMTTYLFLYALAPLLNLLYDKMSLKAFAFVTLALWVVCFLKDFQSVLLFCSLYCMGRVIRELNDCGCKVLKNRIVSGGGICYVRSL